MFATRSGELADPQFGMSIQNRGLDADELIHGYNRQPRTTTLNQVFRQSLSSQGFSENHTVDGGVVLFESG